MMFTANELVQAHDGIDLAGEDFCGQDVASASLELEVIHVITGRLDFGEALVANGVEGETDASRSSYRVVGLEAVTEIRRLGIKKPPVREVVVEVVELLENGGLLLPPDNVDAKEAARFC